MKVNIGAECCFCTSVLLGMWTRKSNRMATVEGNSVITNKPWLVCTVCYFSGVVWNVVF